MSRIDDIFAAHRARQESVLMPFVTAGYPTLADTEAVIPALGEAGAGIVELGFPFSDPIADGAVIAASMHEALQAGVTPSEIFAMVRRVRAATDLGLITMVSQSIVERNGPARFVAAAAEAGIDGLIIPDIDLESARTVAGLAAENDLSFSLLVAPTTAPERVAELVSLSTGFVYLLARVGITGEREAAPEIADRVRDLRRHTDLPVAVGFGISTRAHVEAVTRAADAAIVGSALVRRMGETADPVRAAREFVADLARGLSSKAG